MPQKPDLNLSATITLDELLETRTWGVTVREWLEDVATQIITGNHEDDTFGYDEADLVDIEFITELFDTPLIRVTMKFTFPEKEAENAPKT